MHRWKLLWRLEGELFHGCSARGECDSVRSAMRAQIAEFGVRVNCRFERLVGSLKGAFQPAPQRRERRAALARAFELVEQRVHVLWILEGGDPPAEEQRDRDPRELDDV